jgi:hypothetical protein
VLASNTPRLVPLSPFGADLSFPSRLPFTASHSVLRQQNEMSTTPPSIVYLQNVKLKALARIAEILPAIDTKRREIGGLRNLRDAYEKDRTLGDAGAVLEVRFE